MVKILVADDEPLVLELIAFSLINIGGFDVIKAKNGAQALALAQKELPDLISLDVRMPKMTGYQVCDELKKIPATKDIPVVFLSAKGQEAEIQEAMQCGAEDYLTKPFAPDVYVKRIRIILMIHKKL